MPRMKYLPTIFLIAACGGGGGGGAAVDGANQVDAHVFHDAPPSVPEMITISGTATADDQSTSKPLAGVAIAVFKSTDETTPIGTATSGADGTYSFSIPTSGVVVDGYVKATISGYADNFMYPIAPLLADYTADAHMVTSGNFTLLTEFTGQMATLGFVAAVILDGSNAAVGGATVTSTPASGSYAYSNGGGIPGGTMTDPDGQAYFINVPAGNIDIAANKAGLTFHGHTLKAHPGALTTTLISP